MAAACRVYSAHLGANRLAPAIKAFIILYFPEVPVNNIIVRFAAVRIAGLTRTHIGAGLTRSRCALRLFVNLREQRLCGLHQLLLSRLDIGYLAVGKLLILRGIQQGFERVQIALHGRFLRRIDLIANVI